MNTLFLLVLVIQLYIFIQFLCLSKTSLKKMSLASPTFIYENTFFLVYIFKQFFFYYHRKYGVQRYFYSLIGEKINK
jgi:hypothetical protein